MKPDGSSGYEIAFPSTGGNPTTTEITVASGPFSRLIGRVTSYTLTVTALKGEGAEARGSYKCCLNVFVPPTTLAFEHDTDFLNMALQPPGTPYSSDVNITGFRQILNP